MPSHLLLMRHAKSSWADGDLSDHDRPLNTRGQIEADAIANALIARGVAPDVIWASDARRTSETAERIIRITPGAQTIIKTAAFYHASARQVLAECAAAEPPTGKLMLLGHNPGWSELTSRFSGMAVNMSTANCAVFTRIGEGDEKWASPRNWQFEELLDAKALIADKNEDE